MDYLHVIQDSIDQIEEGLREDIRVDQLASRAGFSTYHYYRIFEAYAGMPVMEYVRRRRMAHAAYTMRYTPRILDVALAFGFESHSSFTKAFRRCMGSPPERYRLRAPAAPPRRIVLEDLARYIPIGGIIMEPRIVARPSAWIAGLSIRTTSMDSQNHREIPDFWMKCMQDGSMEKLHALPGIVSHNEFGVCVNPDMDTGAFDYVIGVEVADPDAVPEGFYLYEMTGCTYAVFTTPPAEPDVFADTIQGTWKFLYADWFPRSGYEFAEGYPDFELYDEKSGRETGQQCEIWIPVVKKA